MLADIAAHVTTPYLRGLVIEAVQRRLVDLGVPWPELRVGLECNGRAFHSNPRGLDEDGMRLTTVGEWRIAHATWDRVERDFGGLVDDLRRLMALAWRHLAVGRALSSDIVQE
jgi:hypothetical protein